MTGLTTEELREAVRAVLREILPAQGKDALAVLGGSAGAEPVVLRSDSDLQAFVQRLVALCEDPQERAAIRDGRRRYVLATGDAPDREPPSRDAGSGVVRVDRGAVTERRVNQAAAAGARLVVGPRAVLTPLARDRARALGVVVERETAEREPAERKG
jgi:hypothetical protein